MPRLRSSCVAAFAGVILAATPGHERAAAQAPTAALRASIDDATADQGTPIRPSRPPVGSAPSRIGQVADFATPPASGAGMTGFDSTNAQRRRGRPQPGRSAPGGGPADPTAAGSPASTGDTSTNGAPPPPSDPPALRNQRTTLAARPGATAVTPTAGEDQPANLPPGVVQGLGRTPAIGPVPYPAAAAPLVAVRRKAPAADEDPYDPLGIRVGTFILKPAVETTTGYDTNPGRVPGGRGSLFYTVAPELLVRSDWERHQLNADIRSSYSEYPAVQIANRPNIDAKVDGRVDMTRDARIDLQARYLLSTDYPGSPNLTADIAKLPVFETVGGTAGVTQRFSRLEVSLKGAIDRTEFQDSQLIDGATSSNKDRDYTQYAATLRGSYEITPGVKPFAELSADTRIHDLEVDRSGNMRDSEALIPKLGTTFELSRKLTGEVSVGYVDRAFKDSGLIDVRGLIVDGSLVWTATGLTTVKLTAKSSVDESVLPGTSGVLRRDAGLEVDHAFRRWLIGTAKIGFGFDDYVGAVRVDHRYSASAALAYKLTRSIQIKGELRQEWLRTNVTGADYTATIALAGLRLQR